jgi:CheY-like chemotaxis protein
LPTKTILVVDDEDDIREIAQMSLEEIGNWQVIAASSGAEGIAKAEREHPDAILLDVMMPGMDGPTTVLKLHENSATRMIPVILLTAKVQAMDRQKFAALGVAAILAKPFDPVLLPSQIAKVLGWNSPGESPAAAEQ